MLTAEQAWDVLGRVADPEIPVISVTELGIVREVRAQAQGIDVVVTPTYSGCPAAEAIERLWVFDTDGLTTFMAVVGLSAGHSFIAGLQKSGLSLVFVGLIVAVLPHLTSILFGRYILKMNSLILLGACSGAVTITAALRAVQEEAQSKLPALGYTVPYAIGNILLTAWGPVIVAMMA